MSQSSQVIFSFTAPMMKILTERIMTVVSSLFLHPFISCRVHCNFTSSSSTPNMCAIQNALDIVAKRTCWNDSQIFSAVLFGLHHDAYWKMWHSSTTRQCEWQCTHHTHTTRSRLGSLVVLGVRGTPRSTNSTTTVAPTPNPSVALPEMMEVSWRPAAVVGTLNICMTVAVTATHRRTWTFRKLRSSRRTHTCSGRCKPRVIGSCRPFSMWCDQRTKN